MELSDFPLVFLLKGLFDHNAVKDMKLRYALRTSRVHRGEIDPSLVEQSERRFARAVDPLILLAIAERAVTRTFGNLVGTLFRTICIMNTHTFSFLIAPFAPMLTRRWKSILPLSASADAKSSRAAR
jgi:hypothetical protein